MGKQIEVLIAEPGRNAMIRRISASLESLQSIVSGYIEAIYPFDDPVVLICNEEGKLRGLELNRSIRDREGKVADIIQGTFFLCGIGDEEFEPSLQILTVRPAHNMGSERTAESASMSRKRTVVGALHPTTMMKGPSA